MYQIQRSGKVAMVEYLKEKYNLIPVWTMEDIVDSIYEFIEDELLSGKSVNFKDVGSLRIIPCTYHGKMRTVRGRKYPVKAKYRLVIHPSENMKAMCEGDMPNVRG